MGESPIKWYDEQLKEKQEKIKNNKSSKFFGLFEKKK